MSDVEKRIGQWRRGLAGAETMTNADLQELESHLREESEHLATAGLSGEEAFLVARHRLGDPAALEEEFAKVHPQRGLVRRLSWALPGVLLYLAATEFAQALFSLSLSLGHWAGLRPTAVGLVGSAVQIAGFVAGVLVAVWLYRRHAHPGTAGGTGNSLRMLMVVAAGLALGTWAFLVLDRLLTVLFVRMVGPAQFGAALYPAAYVREAWHLLLPVVLAGLVVVLSLRRRRDFQVQP
ncbi:MAG: permease prefix domain 1-containing protein [Planctomycetes bacterium]|nr:permease prefix domain 1-containing protein [Planctomycetota bacterium]